jgi:hypothetical protein
MTDFQEDWLLALSLFWCLHVLVAVFGALLNSDDAPPCHRLVCIASR